MTRKHRLKFSCGSAFQQKNPFGWRRQNAGPTAGVRTLTRHRGPMQIRYGYEITVNCSQPTAMVCLMSLSEDLKDRLLVPESFFTTPSIPTRIYFDTFGNRCRRLLAPYGDLTLWGDATIEDSGEVDPAAPGAAEIPVADLPDACLLYLMGSRYCETDRLSQTAWDLFGATPPGWRACRPSAILFISISGSTISRPDRPARRSKRSTSGSACAGTSPIWR